MSKLAYKSLPTQSLLNSEAQSHTDSVRPDTCEHGLFIERVIRQGIAIPYLPVLSFILGDVYATIFLQQAFYRFKSNQYRPFYKFISPCASRFYRSGDSWLEELAFTRRQIQRAIKKVSTRISATKRCQGQDKDLVLSDTVVELDAMGKMANSNALVLYWFTRDHKTWWIVNTPLLLDTLRIAQFTNARFVDQSLTETSSGLLHKTCSGFPHAEKTNRENHNKLSYIGLSTEKKPQIERGDSTSPEIAQYVDLVAQLCGIKLNLCSPILESKIIEIARHFHNAQRTFEQIVLIGHWWRHHFWKGQRGTPPTPSDLLDMYGVAESFYRKGEGGDCCRVAVQQWRSTHGLEAERV